MLPKLDDLADELEVENFFSPSIPQMQQNDKGGNSPQIQQNLKGRNLPQGNQNSQSGENSKNRNLPQVLTPTPPQNTPKRGSKSHSIRASSYFWGGVGGVVHPSGRHLKLTEKLDYLLEFYLSNREA